MTALNALFYTRLAALVSSVIIVIGSISLHTTTSGPLNIPELREQVTLNDNWILQMITDRRLISTLVAAQGSIFCPLFVLAANMTVELTDSFTEMACQVLMPLGLAFCWVFSILFDLKSTDILVDGNFCLVNENCSVFMFLHGLKYIIVGLFVLEPILMAAICHESYQASRIQLPLIKDVEKN